MNTVECPTCGTPQKLAEPTFNGAMYTCRYCNGCIEVVVDEQGKVSAKGKEADPSAYDPTSVDIEWANYIMKLLKDQSVLAFPGTKLVYLVDKTNKTLILQNPVILMDDPAAVVIHARTKETFRMINYSVKELHDG